MKNQGVRKQAAAQYTKHMVASPPMKRVVILLGAGASVDFGAPGTNQLTEVITERVTSDDWVRRQGGDIAFSKIANDLAKYFSNPGVVSYEQIYHCAHELQCFEEPGSGTADEYRYLLLPFVSNCSGLGTAALQAMDRKILEVIFAEILRACRQPKRSLDPFGTFLRTIKNHHVLRIYTTNHDDFPLQTLEGLYTGFDVTSGRFDVAGFWKRWSEAAIFHLHGSIHLGSGDPSRGDDLGDFIWYTDLDEGYRHARWSYASERRRQDGGRTARFPLITGLDKLSVIQHPPFCYYYAGLAKDLMEADLIYVIGSSLGDLHVNAWLHETRRRRPRPPLILVDYWKEGFLSTLSETEPKLVEMIHSLGILRESRHSNAPSAPDGWIISDDATAAVWDSGFLEFLAQPEKLQTVLSILRC